MNENNDLEKEFDFSQARPNPYADKLRKADGIRVTIHKKDGTKEVRTYPSIDEMAADRCRVQLDREQYGALIRTARRKDVSHEKLLQKWVDEGLEREEAGSS